MMSTNTPPRLGLLPGLIFSSRWLQLPLYLGLIVAQGVYVMLFLKELWHLLTHATSFGEMEIMLLVLGLIDVVMISNLLVMVIVGGYETFVSRLRLQNHPDQPEWLSHVNASVLKVKLAMAIIGISSIHLLRTFIEAGTLGTPNARFTEAGVMWQTIIHALFIASALGIALVDRLSSPSTRSTTEQRLGLPHANAAGVGCRRRATRRACRSMIAAWSTAGRACRKAAILLLCHAPIPDRSASTMTILVYAANARALWDTIQADIPAIGAKGTSSSNTWRKDDSGRATKIYRAMPTGEHDERAYFVGTVRTGQLLLLDLLPGSETLTWPLFGALHGHLSGMLLDTYSDAVLSLNLYPNRPIEG